MRSLATSLHNVGFALAFVLLGVLAWQGGRTQDALLDAYADVARSLELITTVQGTYSALQDVETGVRGFVLTGDESYLDPYHYGRRRLHVQRERLGALIGPEPARQAWLAETDRAIARRLELAASNVEARRRTGLTAAASHLHRGGAKQAMDRVRALLSTLETNERQRLAQRHAAVSTQLERGRRQAVLGGLVAVALLLGALISMNRSLRQRARLARRAQAGEARQTALLQAIPDTLWQVQPDGAMQCLSAQGGCDAATLPAGLAATIEARLPQAVPGGGVQALDWHDEEGREYELRLVAAAGGDRLAIVRDVTEAARNRRALRDQHAFLRTTVDTDENLIFVRDIAGRFVLANIAFCDVLLLDPAQVEGRHPDGLDGHAHIEPLLEGDAALAAGESEWRHEQVRIVDMQGTERWLQVLKRPLELAAGRHVLTVAVDVTARLQAERMKNEFVSTVSHELRTPLTSIRGALGMLTGALAHELPPDARPLLDIAHKNTERLVRLINDILDIEKLKSGHLPLLLRRLPLRTLVEQALEYNATYAREFGVRMVLAPGDDGEVEVDPDRFAQVMANLLSNAIKHSPEGGTVEVAVTRRHGGLQVSVADHGPGIPEHFRTRVFERFAQADASDVRRRGGTGLGLAITRALVEQMQGTIGFDSIAGEGTRFDVWLPLAPSPPPAATPAARDDAPSVVLLVEEVALAGDLARMLGEHGYAARLATSPAQARAQLDRGDVRGIVIDLALPGDDAPAFLHELRLDARYARLPVLVLALQRPDADAVLRGGAAGVVDWLRKPLDPEQVAATVRRCLHGSGAEPQVLHVEDDADLRALIGRLLGTQPLLLHGAGSLADARAQLAARRYDLVILDLVLPDGDGADLLPELAAVHPPTPAIIFSAHDTTLPDSRMVLRHLVKSRNDAGELARVIAAQLRHWPSADASPETP